MEVVAKKDFANGTVYCLRLDDGRLIETTDTFLPFNTKDAIGRKQNTLTSTDCGSRAERWMIGVSVMSGCPVRCKFCATGAMKGYRNLTAEEIVKQVWFVIGENIKKGYNPNKSLEFKINYTRMGEPFLNLHEVRNAMAMINMPFPNTHHYISTIGVQDADFSWINGNVTLQVSVHSLDDTRRNELIPFNRKMTLQQLGQIRTQSNLKTTVNMTLVDEADFDIAKLKEYFDPKYFFIKLSPINPNVISEGNNLGVGIIEGVNLV